jgi:hypothetical protein
MVFYDSNITNSFQEVTNTNINTLELEFSDEYLCALKEFELQDKPLEIQDHFIKLYYILRKHYIDIIGWKKVNLEIRYFFKRVDDIVAVKFWINGKNEFNKNFMHLPQPNDSKVLFDDIKSIINDSQPIVINRVGAESVLTKIQFEIELEENRPFLLSLYFEFKELIAKKNFTIDKIEHFQYRERYYFQRDSEKAVVDFEYDRQGLFGRILPLDTASNSQDLMFEIKNLIDQIKTNQHVI